MLQINLKLSMCMTLRRLNLEDCGSETTKDYNQYLVWTSSHILHPQIFSFKVS